jgi:hypothetical protein
MTTTRSVTGRLLERLGPIGASGAGEGTGSSRLADAYLGRTGAVATLTLLAYVTVPPPGTLTITRVVAAIGLLLVPVVGRDARFWGGLLVLAAVGTLRQPLLDLDNHHVLQLYWLAALCLGNLATDPVTAVRRTARLLIGLAFLFATVWKLLSPDFVDGSFLTYLFSAEPNAGRVAVGLGWQDDDLVVANRTAVGELHADPAGAPGPVELEVADTTSRAAVPLAWLTIAVEGAVALLFLLPVGTRWRWVRDAALVAFIALTYLLLPVVTFGVLLAALGVAQSELPEQRAAALYLAVALIIAFAS